jgi:folate-binding protein YgfZ
MFHVASNVELFSPEQFFSREQAAYRELVLVPLSVIKVSGPDAFKFLQGQLTQDLSRLENESETLSALTTPEGKLLAPLKVIHEQDAYLLICETELSDAVIARLTRYLIRTKAVIEPLSLEVAAPVVKGDPLWPISQAVIGVGNQLEPATYECLRISLGAFRLSRDGTDSLLVHSFPTLVGRAVSFTKGCYTGQELVARTDSRGAAPPEALVQLAFDPSAIELRDLPIELTSEGRPALTITSSCLCDGQGCAVGRIKRRFYGVTKLETELGVFTIREQQSLL